MSIRTIVLIAVGLLLIYLMFTVGAPFLLALIVAIFLEPLTVFLMKRFRLNRLVSAVISSTLFTVILVGLIVLLGMKIIAELIAFLEKVPNYFENASTFVDNLLVDARGLYQNLPPDAIATLEEYLMSLTNTITSMVGKLSSTVLGFASTLPGMFIFFIVFLVAVYMFSFSLNTMKASVLSFFDESSRSQVDQVLNNLRKSIFGFLRSQIILSGMTYILSLIGLLILGIKYPMAIALLIIIVDILPILGTGSVLVPWASYLLLTGDIYTGIGLIVLFLVITVFRRIVEPKILGDSVGIGALPALISLYVGFKLVGVIGVFIGPLVVIIYMAARQAGLFQQKIKL
ncbi:sporulation integral membrane protein YtvI [Paenibacillus sp. MY03]|jgi:sporulation integral membrane protein YtvI|uniref:Sporulation integral membrane protein YtvI n=1 Tax=Paenibacillus agaridevorans TaxID=171404 RepID=A0A2R5F544_9BACL|nr:MULTISPECIES: sporulation integral membrane protein YtvI [Paenibacillus]OUS70077.1 sporulation integral membrane protein YtvI [Paenibacillus sp. MY03]QNK56036.1 sporulation integral membrane protein YtvI [Paenibacillus sp. PAMC21692]GBG11401.1 sporulation integral membrane protein YtvI [Paenibacillus agaridevorans]